MRICHLSDSHLGAGANHPRRGDSGLTLRQEDIVSSFVEAISRITELRPDLCLHAGDLFHDVRPLNRIMAIAGRELHRLADENGVPTVVIAGNHDAPKMSHVGAALEVYEQIENLYVAAAGRLQVFEIGEALICALPHCLTAESLKGELAKCVPPQDSRYKILLAHGVAAGMPQFSMADLGEQEIALGAMEPFHYVAMGHYHNYCRVAPRAYYAGSTERLSQAERESAKGFLVVDLEPFKVTFEEIRCRAMVDIEPIRAAGRRGDQIAAELKERVERLDSSDKIVRVTIDGVTDETLRTIPQEVISDLKRKSFSLNIRVERETSTEARIEVGRAGIGQLDQAFMEFIESVNVEGLDRERLKRDAVQYLSEEE